MRAACLEIKQRQGRVEDDLEHTVDRDQNGAELGIAACELVPNQHLLRHTQIKLLCVWV